jgi:hypothetical protein
MNLVLLIKDRLSLINTRLPVLSGIFEIESSKEGIYLPILKRTCERKSKLTGGLVLTFNNIHDILCDTTLLVKSTYETEIALNLLNMFVSMTTWLVYAPSMDTLTSATQAAVSPTS